MSQLERRSDRWISALQSVALHGAIVAALVFGWWAIRHRPAPPPTLALNATVVSEKELNGVNIPKAKPTAHPTPAKAAPPEPKPPPPAPAKPQAPPTADDQTVPAPADLASRKAAAQQAAAAQAEAERKAKQLAKQKQEAEAEAKAKAAAAERRAEEKRLAEAKAKAAAKLAAEKKRKAEEKLQAELARQAAEAKALAMNRSDLAASVTAEEKQMTARSGPALASWVQEITAKIEQAWIRPPSAKSGIDCVIDVTQVPGGEIVSVKVDTCNGDEAVVQSIQDAAYRASPLPPPPDPALFERDLEIEFKPN